MRRLCLLTVLAASACGSPLYEVSTCSFAGKTDGCTASTPIDRPAATALYHFTLVNPRQPMSACSGELQLEVRGGRAHFHAQEKSPADCSQVGDAVEGTGDIHGELVQDVYFPAQDYTFRFTVKEQ